MAVAIKVPTLGESVSEATVTKWFKKVGDAVEVDEPLVELETDKVTVEVPSPSAGVLAEILVQDGGEVEVGATLGNVDVEASAVRSATPETKSAAASKAPQKQAAVPQEAPKRPAKSGGTVEVVVPALGESITEGTIAKWLVGIGEVVAADDPLVELETDKATVEIPAPVAGTLSEIKVEEGADVEVGAVLASIAEGDAPAAKPQQAPAAGPQTAEAEARQGEARVPAGGRNAALSPAVRKLVEDNAVDPARIPATGPKGQITKGDVLEFIDKRREAGPTPSESPRAPVARPAPAPRPTIVPAGELPERKADPRGEERIRMSRLRQRIAERLKDAQNTAAMLTTFNEVNMDALMKIRNEHREAFEKKHGARLGFLSFFVKACIGALKELPAVNGEVYGDEIIYKNYYDVGIAVGTPQGLVVPVLRDADAMSFAEIENSIADFGRRARDGKLTVAEMTGGTFTISNGGVYGSLMSMPILNPPQSGILGMHKIEKRPIAVGGEVKICNMMYLALSYDHRIVDGREAVTFLVRVKEFLEDPQRLLIGV